MENIPADLRKALASDKVAASAWKDLTPIGRRDFISWITSAKQAETRVRRIEKATSMLAAGKRRPCCYALVPLNLYSALGKNKKAKENWKVLSPDAKRDFLDWIELEKDAVKREMRIDKVSVLLAAGKKHP